MCRGHGHLPAQTLTAIRKKILSIKNEEMGPYSPKQLVNQQVQLLGCCISRNMELSSELSSCISGLQVDNHVWDMFGD